MTEAPGVSGHRGAPGDKRASELSRWFRSSLLHHKHNHHSHQQQQQQSADADYDVGDVGQIEWNSHAWTFDELVRLYSKKLPVIVRATRGYYGQPAAMQLEVGQV